MSNALQGLEPAAVWKYFGEISKIPRGSKNEAAVARFVLDTAARLGLEAKQEPVGNVIVRKPGSPGKEKVRSVCLQGHLDMVCEKNADKVHDFMKDPLELVLKGDVLMANGTTLGADNGIAVAAMLALMETSGLEHGPLEFLFTIDEETGLTGAGSLEASSLQSRTLLNLDSEEEGELYVGCAGGRDTLGSWAIETEVPRGNFAPFQVSVKGLKGGHSGLDIHKGRGNAIKLVARSLARLLELGARLVSMTGGNKRNAIPREASAIVLLPQSRMKKAQKLVAELEGIFKAEIATVDPDLSLAFTSAEAGDGRVLKRSLQKKIVQTILALPHGVIKMSADIPGLVETSTNVAVVSTTVEALSLATSQRSSVASEIQEIVESVTAIFALGSAKVEGGKGYPGWKPNLASPILAVAKRTYQELTGVEPKVKAVHAGLECGIIGEKIPGMDMVSFGPTLEAVHSPEEKIFVSTVAKFWTYLLAILKNFR